MKTSAVCNSTLPGSTSADGRDQNIANASTGSLMSLTEARGAAVLRISSFPQTRQNHFCSGEKTQLGLTFFPAIQQDLRTDALRWWRFLPLFLQCPLKGHRNHLFRPIIHHRPNTDITHGDAGLLLRPSLLWSSCLSALKTASNVLHSTGVPVTAEAKLSACLNPKR